MRVHEDREGGAEPLDSAPAIPGRPAAPPSPPRRSCVRLDQVRAAHALGHEHLVGRPARSPPRCRRSSRCRGQASSIANQARSGSRGARAPRMSDRTMTGSFFARSTSTPAKRPKIGKGAAHRGEHAHLDGLASSSSAAVSGSARNVICPPKWVIVSDPQARKSALRHRPVEGAGRIQMLHQLRHFFFPRRECTSRVARSGKYSAFGLRPRLEIPGGDRPAGQSMPLGMHAASACTRRLIEERSAIFWRARFMVVVRAREWGAQYSEAPGAGNCEEAVKNGPWRPFRG